MLFRVDLLYYIHLKKIVFCFQLLLIQLLLFLYWNLYYLKHFLLQKNLLYFIVSSYSLINCFLILLLSYLSYPSILIFCILDMQTVLSNNECNFLLLKQQEDYRILFSIILLSSSVKDNCCSHRICSKL